MLPRSRSLFHFTSSMDVLCAVLKNGFWPRYCLEDVEWQGHEDTDFIAFPMVCFCDIPIGRIEDHIGFYGPFGIGLTKEWGIKNNLNPVIYFSGDNPLHKAIKSLTNITHELLEGDNKKFGLLHLRHILAHSKPTNGRMIIAGKPVEKDFYQESEWRFVPQHEDVPDFLKPDDFLDKENLSSCNELTSNLCRIRFLPNDIRYLFVPKDSDIPEMMNFIQTELDNYPNADLKVLMSRVTSIESITLDV